MGSTDREEKDRYTLEVQAKDGGNKVTAQIALCVLHFYSIAELNTSSSRNKYFILTSNYPHTKKKISSYKEFLFGLFFAEKVFLLGLNRCDSQTFKRSNWKKHFFQCVCYLYNLLRCYFLVSDATLTLFFINEMFLKNSKPLWNPVFTNTIFMFLKKLLREEKITEHLVPM